MQENLFKKNGRLRITVTVEEEPDFQPVEEFRQKLVKSYRTLHSISRQLGKFLQLIILFFLDTVIVGYFFNICFKVYVKTMPVYYL